LNTAQNRKDRVSRQGPDERGPSRHRLGEEALPGGRAAPGAVIILQTPDWVASKWCFAEFTQARALGKAIFSVIETPTVGARIAPDIQSLDLTGDREAGLERLKRELRRNPHQ
jgi:hypothetical protein